MNYKTGLLVGRFQPFHNGHLYLIKEALKHVENLVIGIGSSNITDADNPISFEKRKKMLEEVIKKEGLKSKIIKIVDLPDIPDDMEWARRTLKACGSVDLVIGNNISGVNIFFEKLGYPVLTIPYYRRDILEGKKIRHLMNTGKKWQERVPLYLVSQIENEQ